MEGNKARQKDLLTDKPSTDLNMPFAAMFRVVIIVILLNRHISKMNIRIGYIISIVCISRVAKPRKPMRISSIGWYNKRNFSQREKV